MEETHVFFLRAKEYLWHPWIGALIVAAFFGGWYFFIKTTAPASEFMTVQTGDFAEEVHVSGTVEASSNVDLGFAQSGRVKAVYANVGDRVTRGAALAEIDNDDLSAIVTQKQAALDSQKAKLASMQGGTRPEQIAVTEAQVDSDGIALEQANQSLIHAIQNAYSVSDTTVRNVVDPFFSNAHSANPKINFTVSDSSIALALEDARLSTESMLKEWLASVSGIASSNMSAVYASATISGGNLSHMSTLLSDANAALESAISGQTPAQISAWLAQVGEARATINTTITSLQSAIAAQKNSSSQLIKDQRTLDLEKAGATGADLDAQIAAVASARADVQTAVAQLEKTIIRAPFGGTVTKMDAKVGAVISPNDPEISLMSNGVFRIVAYVPEVDIAHIAVGNMATTSLDAYGSSVFFPVVVVAIDPAQTTVGGISTYKTTLQFLQKDSRILSGMTASVAITTSHHEGAIAIPQSAIIYVSGIPHARVRKGDRIETVQIQLGASSALGNAEVISGLQNGDEIVLNP